VYKLCTFLTKNQKSHKTELPLKLQNCIIQLLVCLLHSCFFLFKECNRELKTFALFSQIINTLLLLYQLRLNTFILIRPSTVFRLQFLITIIILYVTDNKSQPPDCSTANNKTPKNALIMFCILWLQEFLLHNGTLKYKLLITLYALDIP